MKLSDQAYNKLKSMILSNKFKINQQLLVDEAVSLVGFSRTPVREALLRLQEDGLIKLHPRHGMKICSLSKKDIEELYELIAHLEVMAIEMCIYNKLSAIQLQELRDYTRAMKGALEKGDIKEWSEHDNRFHQAIFNFTGNSRLVEVARKYSEQNKRCKDMVMKIRPLPWDSINEHEQIIDSIEAGDGKKARELHLAHWNKVSRQFIGFLDEHHFVNIDD